MPRAGLIGSAAFSSTAANTWMKLFRARSRGWPPSSANSSRNAAIKNIGLPRKLQLALPGVSLQREFDQLVKELRIRKPIVRPHLWIHADGRKAGNCVYLVDENLSTGTLDQKVDARHPLAADRLEAC